MQARTDEQAVVAGAEAVVDRAKVQRLTNQIRGDQNLVLGCVGGIVAAAIGAAIWALITYATNYQIGWMAVGVGLLVGLAVRRFGKGIDKVFGIAGAALALAGCLAGNLLTFCLVVSRHEGVPVLDLVSRLDANVIVKILSATFNPIDLLFYGLAVYEGYRFSFRPIAEGEVAGTAT